MKKSFLLLLTFFSLRVFPQQVDPLVDSFEKYRTQAIVPGQEHSLGLTLDFNGNDSDEILASGCEIVHLQNSLPTLYDINEIQFVTNDVGYAVGNGGVVLRTEDSGDSWDFLNTGGGEQNFGLHFVDEMNGFIKSRFNILKTDDGGQSWSVVGPQIFGEHLLFLNELTGFANEEGDLYRTLDGGENWNLVESFDSRISNIHVYNNSEVLLHTITAIYHSDDNGENWETLFQDESAELRYAEFFDLQKWFVTTNYLSEIEGVALVKTMDAGQTWDTLKLDIFESTTPRIHFIDDTNGFVYGGDSPEFSPVANAPYAILKTTDGGDTWVEVNATTTFNRFDYDMTFVDDGIGFVVGRFGSIQKTVDYGENWFSVTSNDTHFLYALEYNEDLGLVGGEGGTIYRTTNSGKDWNKVVSNTNYWVRDFSWGEQNVYAVSSLLTSTSIDSDIIKSTDGGQTWEVVFSSVQDLRTIHFFDDMNGFASGSSGTYYSTTDGGENWAISTLATSSRIKQSFFIGASIGYLAADGILLKTTDGGDTWMVTNETDIGLANSMFFVDEDLGFIGGDRGEIYRTQDGGISFDTLKVESNPDIYSIFFFDSDNGYIATSFNIQFTTNGGQSWNRIGVPTSSELRGIHFTDEFNATVIGRAGAIFNLLIGQPQEQFTIIGDEEWCLLDGSQTLTLSDSNGKSFYDFSWSLSDGGTITGSEIGSITWNRTGTFDVTVYASNACGDGPTSTLTITVLDVPVPEIEFDGSDQLSTNSAGDIQWYLNGNPLDGKNSTSLQVIDEGIYSVQVTNLCGSEFSEDFVFPVLGNSDLLPEVIVYPNPASDELHIEVPSDESNLFQVDILDTTGKRFNLNSTFLGGKVVLDISSLNKGVYLLNIKKSSTKTTRRIVIR